MIDAQTAKRISRGRAIAMSYAAMTGLGPEDLPDTASVDCIADLLHAVVSEPFDRAGLGAEDKLVIAEATVRQALDHFEAELRGEE